MIGGNQSWVTMALNDTNVWQALVLARSLKNNFTTRKLSILITENVSPPMKFILQQEFDLVQSFEASELAFQINNNDEKAKLSNSLAKIYCWNLRTWDKCVYLDVNTLVLENCDEIFDYNEMSVVSNGGKCGFKFNTNLFVFQPCTNVFEELLETAGGIIDATGDVVLNKHFANWNAAPKQEIDKLYITTIAEIDLESDSLPRIIHYTSLSWLLTAKKEDEKLKGIESAWLTIFSNDVLPKVENQKRSSVKEYLKESMVKNNLNSKFVPKEPLTSQVPPELKDAIAIIGMSCRFPGANSPDEFWSMLKEGRDPISVFPKDRPSIGGDVLDQPYFEAGFLKCQVDEFDAKFFGISPREAPFVDPQQRILLEVTWECLENAGINPQTLKDSDTGVYMGIWQQDYDRYLPNVGLSANDFHHRYLGNAFSATASRISYFLGLHGPSISLESGCSSSLAGLALACDSLRRGETSLCISSGVNLVLMVLNPLAGDDKAAVILSKDHRCKTFDESADGFVRAEGCGAVVLKRYADAHRDGDNILAIVRGAALNNDGAGTSFGTPNAKAQERVFREALKNANVLPSEVSYVEAHGTGTVVGDPTEMYAIGRVYSEGRTEPLLVSSVKTNIGHAEACAGMAGLIKTILCMKHEAIPPHLHLKTLNPRINLEAIPAKIPTELTEWKGKRRIAAVSSFSMSGTNVHVLLEEPRISKLPIALAVSSRKPHVLTISAKSEEALEALRERYLKYLDENPNVNIDDVAYSTNIGRANLAHRIAIVAKDIGQLVSKLEKRVYEIGKIPPHQSKVAFLFTGQGSQYIGMGKSLYETFPAYQKSFDSCDLLFQKHLNKSLKHVVWTNNEYLEQTIYCQPAIFCLQFSLLQVWSHFGVLPDTVLGHSVGEFAAAVSAGIFTLKDAMLLVVQRSRLVESLPRGSMLAVRESFDKVRSLIQEFRKSSKTVWIDVAAINSLEETVVSGNSVNIDDFAEFIGKKGVKSQFIPASHAFHSRDMDSIMSVFGKTVLSIKFNEPKCTYVSGTLAKKVVFEDIGPAYWARHLRDTVRFSEAIKEVWAECKILIEIGPQPILLGLAMANINDTSSGYFCPSLRRSEEDWYTVFMGISKLYVAGINVEWKNWFGPKNTKLPLPTYPFQRQKFWYTGEETSMLTGMQLTSKLLHPLLGRQLPSAMTDTIYCHTLKLRDLQYVDDHRVADRVILPGAAYLETILAAGREIIQGGSISIPLTVENLAIEAALELDKPSNVQTLVSAAHTEDGVHFNVEIHRQMVTDQPDKWKRHAHGVFRPSIKLPDTQLLNIGELKSRLTIKDSLEKAYATIAEMGIQFGPKFQSISSAWSGPSELLTQILLPDDSSKYVCHPIVIDAMIQTYAFRYALASTSPDKDLRLPIGIRKFVWLSKTPTSQLFAHTTWDNAEGNVTLYSEAGAQLAIMEGLELVQTTVDSFVRTLNSHRLQLPGLYHEVWRPTMSVTRSRVDLSLIQIPNINSSHVARCVVDIAEFENREWDGQMKIEDMFFLFLLRGIQECDWPWPSVGKTITPACWKSIAPEHFRTTNLIESFFEFLKHDGFLTHGESNFTVQKALPSLSECERMIQENRQVAERILGEDDILLRYTLRCEQHFTRVLQGKMTPLQYMFPDDPNEIAAARFYTESKWYSYTSSIGISMVLDTVTPFAEKGNGVVRILEVGAGSAISSQRIMEKLTELGIQFQYTFTDISPVFIAEAKKKLKKDVVFGILNIEEDPLGQGYAPEQYDVVVAMQVIHATRDINESLVNLRKLLRKDGAIILCEQFNHTHLISLSFGFLDGWWRFQDFRTLGPIVSGETWTDCLTQSGYSGAQAISIYRGTNGGVIARNSNEPLYNSIKPTKSWLLFGDNSRLDFALQEKLSESNRNVIFVDLNTPNCVFQQDDLNKFSLDSMMPEHFQKLFESIQPLQLEGIIYLWTKLNGNKMELEEVQKRVCGGLLHLCQEVAGFCLNIKQKPKLVYVTRGVNYLGDAEAGNPEAATGWGLLKSFSNENPDLSISLIDVDQNETDIDKESIDLFAELWSREKENFVVFRENRRFVQRVQNWETRTVPMKLPNSDRFKLQNPASGSFADFQLCPAPKLNILDDSVEVAIEATALNFRDLFMILKPEGFEMPKSMPKDAPSDPGLDISGVVTSVGPNVRRFRVGDEVFGFTIAGGCASHVVVSEYALLKKPKHMTFASASTIPCAFLTVYYAFVECAKLNSKDRVLIHVATGGVGLAAIQVANHIGAEIYATAGSRKKRAYLRSLGIKYVYHSRNTEYGQGIQKDTNGKGVTVVLNSLTGPNFKETSLKSCSQNARFLEIGKLNIWSSEEVKALRPDVEYFIIDLAEMSYDAPKDIQNYIQGMEAEFEKGIYRGLPHITFPLDLAREAFQHFQETKHIGKIVITIPKATVSSDGRLSLHQNLFNPISTYLITGGLGGLGMEVAKWMTTTGAKYIVLAGRNTPNYRAQELIDNLNMQGNTIIVVQADVGEHGQCSKLLEAIKSIGLPPVRGIMHAAGVISDGIVPNQSWDKFRSTLQPKVYGGWNLHNLTLEYDLEFFFLFSSIVGVVGMPGQSNHAAANRYLDSLANYRTSLGLPSTSIYFGPWSDIGAAAHIKLGQEGGLGIKSFTPKQGIMAIEKIMRERLSQIAVLEVTDWNLVKQFIRLGHYLDDMQSDLSNQTSYTEEYTKLMEEIKAAPAEEKQERIQNFLEIILKHTLRLPENESIDPDQNFTELGVDSLMAMEMRNQLQGMLGDKTLTISSLQENRTLRSLSTHLANLMNSDNLPAIQIDELIKQDSLLPPEIKATELGPCKPSEFKQILLTGVTGHLGAYILPELTLNPKLKIYCLVRANSEEDGLSRILKTLKRYAITESVDLSRVQAVVGDISKENFGLANEQYHILSENVHAIVHCAVKSNHMDGYTDGGENSIRHHNVFGTLNVLKFASSVQTKAVFYASSLLAVSQATNDGLLHEEFPGITDLGLNIKSGYVLSKFISEKLIFEASQRGIPITVVRYASIFGDSQSGLLPVGNNHAWNILLTCIRVRKFPSFDQNVIPITPVDTAARISTKIFLSDESDTGVYNLTTGSTVSEDDIKEVFSKFGVDGEFVSFKEWRDLVFEEADKNLLGPFGFLYEDDGKSAAPRYLGFHPLADTISNLNIVQLSSKLKKNFPGIEEIIIPAKVVLERHLNYHFQSLEQTKDSSNS